ncbi:MAG: hypothetical protein ICV65_14055, partial [Flavisolibacter sp.]|nr:hypothetical protein [Flavisolibacter sp.]
CATAVFHKLRWEVVIEIGKAICTRYNHSEKMNFTNLLKLSRIGWMNEGVFPAATRLELLKHLEPANEVTARETLLRMMQYADTYFGDNYFFQQEKEVQQITNRFLLYAHDPERFANYESDQQKFKALWEVDKLWDTPQKLYLENPDEQWSTMLQHRNKSIGVNKYFDFKKIEGQQSKRKTVWRNGLIAASLVVLLGLLHLVKNALPNNSILLKSSQAKASYRFYVNNTIPCDNNGTLTSLTGTLHTNDGNTYSFPFEKYSDTSFAADLSFPAGSLSDSNAYLEISWNNGRPVTATSLVSLRRSVIAASISACAILPKYNVSIVYNDPARENEVKAITNFLSGQGYSVKNTVSYEIVDSLSVVYFFSPVDKNGADSLARLLSLQFNNILPAGLQVKNILPANLPMEIKISIDSNLKKTLGVLLNFRNITTGVNRIWNTATLNSSLTEIWHGGTSNRLITINPPMIYYSTGDKRTYGTYRIDEVLRNASGIYKIITRADQQYAVFLIRNVQPNSFELSVCQNRYNTKEEARAIDESYCDRFNQMTPYYENDPAKVFLPVNANNALEASNQQKVKKLNDAIGNAKDNMGNVKAQGRLFYNSRFKPKVPGELPIQITQTTQIPNETPFDRSYIVYGISGVSKNPPVQYAPDCNRVFRSIEETNKIASPLIVCKLDLSGQSFKSLPQRIYQFKNLQQLDLRKTTVTENEIAQLKAAFPNATILYDPPSEYQQNAPVQNNAGITTPERLLSRINLDERGYLDNEAQRVLNQVVNFTQENRTARVRIVFYYLDDASLNTVKNWVAYLEKYLSSLKNNPSQFVLETRRQAAQKQMQQQSSKGYDNLIYYADVYGTNFPNSFLRGAAAN